MQTYQWVSLFHPLSLSLISHCTQIACERQLEPSVHSAHPVHGYRLAGWEVFSQHKPGETRGKAGGQSISGLSQAHLQSIWNDHFPKPGGFFWTVGWNPHRHREAQLVNGFSSKTLSLWEVTAHFLSPYTSIRSVWDGGFNYSFDKCTVIWHDTSYLLLFTQGTTVSWQSGSICSVTLGCRERWNDRHGGGERRKNEQKDGRTVNVPFVTER